MNDYKETKIVECVIHGVKYEATRMFGDIWTNCPTCQAELKERLEKERKERELEKIRAEIKYHDEILAWLGVSQRFICDYRANKITDSAILDLETSEGVKLREVLSIHNDDGLIMLGAAGIGKSYAAYKFVTDRFFDCGNYKIYKIGELENIYKNDNYKARNFENVKKKIQEFEGIIIDEIDDLSADCGREIVNKLICYCYDELKKIIIIGNCDLEVFMSILDEKTRSRIKNFHLLSNFELKDLRQ